MHIFATGMQKIFKNYVSGCETFMSHISYEMTKPNGCPQAHRRRDVNLICVILRQRHSARHPLDHRTYTRSSNAAANKGEEGTRPSNDHRNRRTGGIRQDKHRDHAIQATRLPPARHRCDVPSRRIPVPRDWRTV